MLPTPPPSGPWGAPPPPPPPGYDHGWSRPPWTPEVAQPRSRRRIWITLGAVAGFVALVVVLVIIGRNPPHVGSNGESAKPTDVILADSGRALGSATYAHVWGSASTDGESEGLDLDMGSGWTTGTVTVKGATAQVIVIGDDVYLRGHDFIALAAGQDVADMVGDSWVHPPSGTDIPGASYLKLSGLQGVFDTATEQGLRLGRGGTVHDGGHLAFELRDSSGSIDIAADGKPYPLRLRADTGGTTVDLHLDDFNHDLPAPSPPDDVFGAPGPLSL